MVITEGDFNTWELTTLSELFSLTSHVEDGLGVDLNKVSLFFWTEVTLLGDVSSFIHLGMGGGETEVEDEDEVGVDDVIPLGLFLVKSNCCMWLLYSLSLEFSDELLLFDADPDMEEIILNQIFWIYFMMIIYNYLSKIN